MKVKEIISLLKQGAAVQFPVQYGMAVLLELAGSNLNKKFMGMISRDEITLQIVEDDTTLN